MALRGFNNGDFVVGKKLGDGTFGEIYKAQTKKDSKAVVLKVIPFLSEKRKNSFIRESVISNKLCAQSNIIAVNTCYYNNKLGVIVMEQMDCDLLEFVMRQQRLSEQISKIIFKQVCIALYQCHSNGIAHLDVKPDNILLKINPHTNEVEAVKLADFGFSYDFSSRSLSSNSDSQNAFGFDFEFNQIVGTKEYRAPETYNSSFYADKADLWCLGITLFAMITGSFPFAEVNGETLRNDFELISKNCKDEKCFDLVNQLLHSDPSRREDILQVLSHPWLLDY